MDRDEDDRLASLTLLAAQTDFEEAGELLLFIDESQLALLEDMMHVAGHLDARKMASAFYALRANELLFAKLVERYLLGEPVKPRPLDAWLADPTRMPARMHGEYLRQLFMENRFAHGNYEIDGRAVALKDIRTPIFALGAERDHIAPWRSVYKIELFGSAETTFVLTGGGHNSSVVSPPGKSGAYYWISHVPAGADFIDPDVWLEQAPKQSGSWWPEWVAWLHARSTKDQVKARQPRPIGSNQPPLGDAPGQYVFER
jgi:polyhydroxyalkanoate synthase